MNSFMIDIIFVAFLILMTFFGYRKGFITRLVDLIGTVLVLFLSCFLVNPLSSIITLYKFDQSDILATMVGSFLNYILIFIILLIGLMIIKKIIGIFIKPILKKIMNTFSLTSFVDKTLGIVLSLVEGLLISYIVLVFIVVPFTKNGTTAIEGTVAAKYVLKIVPSVSEKVIDLNQSLKNQSEDSYNSVEALTQLLLTANDMNLIDDADAQKIFTENIENELITKGITLSSSQKQQIVHILKEAGYNDEQIQSISLKINVSGE